MDEKRADKDTFGVKQLGFIPMNNTAVGREALQKRVSALRKSVGRLHSDLQPDHKCSDSSELQQLRKDNAALRRKINLLEKRKYDEDPQRLQSMQSPLKVVKDIHPNQDSSPDSRHCSNLMRWKLSAAAHGSQHATRPLMPTIPAHGPLARSSPGRRHSSPPEGKSGGEARLEEEVVPCGGGEATNPGNRDLAEPPRQRFLSPRAESPAICPRSPVAGSGSNSSSPRSLRINHGVEVPCNRVDAVKNVTESNAKSSRKPAPVPSNHAHAEQIAALVPPASGTLPAQHVATHRIYTPSLSGSSSSSDFPRNHQPSRVTEARATRTTRTRPSGTRKSKASLASFAGRKSHISTLAALIARQTLNLDKHTAMLNDIVTRTERLRQTGSPALALGLTSARGSRRKSSKRETKVRPPSAGRSSTTQPRRGSNATSRNTHDAPASRSAEPVPKRTATRSYVIRKPFHSLLARQKESITHFSQDFYRNTHDSSKRIDHSPLGKTGEDVFRRTASLSPRLCHSETVSPRLSPVSAARWTYAIAGGVSPRVDPRLPFERGHQDSVRYITSPSSPSQTDTALSSPKLSPTGTTCFTYSGGVSPRGDTDALGSPLIHCVTRSSGEKSAKKSSSSFNPKERVSGKGTRGSAVSPPQKTRASAPPPGMAPAGVPKHWRKLCCDAAAAGMPKRCLIQRFRWRGSLTVECRISWYNTASGVPTHGEETTSFHLKKQATWGGLGSKQKRTRWVAIKRKGVSVRSRPDCAWTEWPVFGRALFREALGL